MGPIIGLSSDDDGNNLNSVWRATVLSPYRNASLLIRKIGEEVHMQAFTIILIIIGAANMIINVYRYAKFLRSSQDVLSSGRKRDSFWMNLALVLLVFFLLGYVFVGLFSTPDLMVALILFFGSVFVTIVETLMFRLIDTAKERSIDVAEVLVGVIDARDPYLNGHSLHVQALTMLLYKYLPKQYKSELNPVSLEYAALLHDVGKLGVPEAILNKPGKLDSEEWKVMHTHPDVGVKILKPLHTFDGISSWIRYHHERIDGNGYYHLPGDQIPLASRMIAIADTYSAITMKRSYKGAKSYEEAMKIMREAAGTQIDKDLFDIFATIPKEELDKCQPKKVDFKKENDDAYIETIQTKV